MPYFSLPKKPTYVPLAVDVDFFGLFKKIRREHLTCFLAESLGETGPTSRYSLIGFSPGHMIRAQDKKLFVDNESMATDNPYLELKKIIPQDCLARRYAGGLFGYFSYETANYLEPSLKIKVHPLFDTFQLGVYTDGLILDTLTRELKYFYYETDRSNLIAKLLAAPEAPDITPQVAMLGDSATRAEHHKMVMDTKTEIIAGNTFQCEVGFKTEYKLVGPSIAIYEQLRALNPSPYMFYLQQGDVTILGASPELLLKVEQREIETAPLAGTARRGASPAEDAELARLLLNDPKEAAEHVMLVDMHRSDVGRVATPGSVKVASLMDIKRFSHVQHIESTIRGILRPGEDMFSALAALLPGGVLSGAPKIESIKIIDRNEPTARGPYGGALGSFGFNGDATFTIPIRSLFIKGEYAYTQTSSGIVYDSDPHNEYEEIIRKRGAIDAALAPFIV